MLLGSSPSPPQFPEQTERRERMTREQVDSIMEEVSKEMKDNEQECFCQAIFAVETDKAISIVRNVLESRMEG